MGCEETEFCIRASQYWPERVFLYEPQARIQHRIPSWRASWRYFRSRCFAEGLSKALVAQYVGSKDGLATERTYIVRTLLRGIVRGVMESISHLDGMGFARAGAIAAGLTFTVAGYSTGILARHVTSHKEIKGHTTGQLVKRLSEEACGREMTRKRQKSLFSEKN